MLNKLSFIALSMLVLLSFTNNANAEGQALTNLQAYSGVASISTSCQTCHSTVPSLNSFGSAYIGLGGTKGAGYVLSATAQNTLLTADTDGDTITNLAELQAGTNPAGGTATTSTTGSASTTGCLASGSNTWIVLLLALILFGFFVSKKKSITIKS